MSLKYILSNSSIATITLNHVAKRNALSLKMISELKNSLKKASNDSARCVILTHESHVFSAGHDLKELKSFSKSETKHLFRECADLSLTIRNASFPVIAKLNGLATAAGAQIVSSCDLAYGSKSAKFCLPGIDIGLACSTPSVTVARAISHQKKALEMLLTGNVIDAEKSVEIGLLNDVFESETLLEQHVEQVAERIAAAPQQVTALAKRVFYKQINENIEDAFDIALPEMSQNADGRNAKEGFDAFLNKRKPQWNHNDL